MLNVKRMLKSETPESLFTKFKFYFLVQLLLHENFFVYCFYVCRIGFYQVERRKSLVLNEHWYEKKSNLFAENECSRPVAHKILFNYWILFCCKVVT